MADFRSDHRQGQLVSTRREFFKLFASAAAIAPAVKPSIGPDVVNWGADPWFRLDDDLSFGIDPLSSLIEYSIEVRTFSQSLRVIHRKNGVVSKIEEIPTRPNQWHLIQMEG